MDILYLCDEKRCDGCTHNNGCYHTSNIKHAVNFKDDGYGVFVEQPAILEEEQNSLLTDLVKELNNMIEKYTQLRLIKFPFVDTFDKERKQLNEVCEAIKHSIEALSSIIKNVSEA